MKTQLVAATGRLRERIEIELDENECRALANGVEVKELKGDTWVVVKPNKFFLDRLKTSTSRVSKPTKSAAQKRRKQ